MSVTYSFDFLSSVPTGEDMSLKYDGGDFESQAGAQTPANFMEGGSMSAPDLSLYYDGGDFESQSGAQTPSSFMDGGTGPLSTSSQHDGKDPLSVFKKFFGDAAGSAGDTIEKVGTWAEKTPKLAEMLMNTGGGLLASIAKQRDVENQIKEAKKARAQENEYRKEAETREMRRAAHVPVKRENWGTGLLDAAMQQKGAR